MSSRALLIPSFRFRSAALVTTLCGCVASVGQVPPPLEAPALAVEHDTYRVRRVRDGDVLELFASLYASGCDSSQARRARPMSEWNGSVGPEQLSPPASSAAHAIA